MLNKLEVAMADMQRGQEAAMLTFEQRHWAALLGNEQRLTERIEEGNVQVVAALALKLDTIQVGRTPYLVCSHILQYLHAGSMMPQRSLRRTRGWTQGPGTARLREQ